LKDDPQCCRCRNDDGWLKSLRNGCCRRDGSPCRSKSCFEWKNGRRDCRWQGGLNCCCGRKLCRSKSCFEWKNGRRDCRWQDGLSCCCGRKLCCSNSCFEWKNGRRDCRWQDGLSCCLNCCLNCWKPLSHGNCRTIAIRRCMSERHCCARKSGHETGHREEERRWRLPSSMLLI